MDSYLYETHLHTSETSQCGKVAAAIAAKIYHDAGYTGIVVTDHYFKGFFDMHPFSSWNRKVDLFLAGYRNALAEGQKLGLEVLLGMEIRFTENANDYLVYGFDESFLRENKKLYRLGLKGFRELTAGMGIYIIQAHPFRPRMVPAPPSLIDGVEVYNGNPRHDSSNHLAMHFATENSLKMLSGSDFHQPQDAARGGIMVAEKLHPDHFTDVFLQGRIKDYKRT